MEHTKIIIKCGEKTLTIDDRLIEFDAFEYYYKYNHGDTIFGIEDKLNGTHEAHNSSVS